jgi:hypothetical protein
MSGRAEESTASALYDDLMIGNTIRLEAELIEMFAVLMRTPVERVDVEIQNWLGRFLSAFGLDRGVLTQIGTEDGLVRITHAWAGPGYEAPPKGTETPLALPWAGGNRPVRRNGCGLRYGRVAG